MGSGRLALITINSCCPHCSRDNFKLRGLQSPGIFGEVTQMLRQLRRPKCLFCREKLSIRIRFLPKAKKHIM